MGRSDWRRKDPCSCDHDRSCLVVDESEEKEMSFRCPNCRKDFGRDIEKLNQHFEENKDCSRDALKKYAESMTNPLLAKAMLDKELEEGKEKANG